MPLGNESFDGVTPPAIPSSIDVVSGAFVTSSAQSFDGSNSLAYAPTGTATEGEANLDGVVNPTEDSFIVTRYVYFGTQGSANAQQFKVLLADATGYDGGGYVGAQLFRNNDGSVLERISLYASAGGGAIHDEATEGAIWPTAVWLKVTVSKNATLVRIEIQRKDNDEYLTPAGTWQSSQVYVYDDSPSVDVPDVIRAQTLFYNDFVAGTTPGSLHADGYVDDTLSSIVVEVTGTISGPVSSVSGSVAAGEVAVVTGTISGPVSTVTGAIDTLTAQTIDIYVASTGDDTTGDGSIGNPYETLEKVRADLEALAPLLNDYIIHLVDKLPLASTFELTEADNVSDGRSVIVYGGPVIGPISSRGGLTGATQITGFALDGTLGGQGVYSTAYSGVSMRFLTINNRRRYRVKRGSGLGGTVTRTATGYTSTSDDIFTTRNVDHVELIYTNNFNFSRNKIASVSSPDITMVAACHQYMELIPEFADPPNEFLLYRERFPIDVENCYEDFVSQTASGGEGLYYYDVDNDTLYYKPYSYENLATAEILAPAGAEILVNHVDMVNPWKWHGCVFSHTHFAMSKGFAERASNRIYDDVNLLSPNRLETDATMPPAAIEYVNCQNIDFSEGNRIHHCSAQGLWARDGITGIITGNKIWGTSGNGMTIGHTTIAEAFNELEGIDNNAIWGVGLEFPGSSALFISKLNNPHIYHNHIKGVAYSGIVIPWATQVNIYLPTILAGPAGEVFYNFVEDVLKVSRDGGAIATGARKDGLEIAYNYVKNTNPQNSGVYHSLGSDIYLSTHGLHSDDLSEDISWHDNVLIETGHANGGESMMFNQLQVGNGVTADNNYVDNTDVSVSAEYPEFYEAPILLTEPIQSEAQTIIDGAGLEEPYFTAFAGEDIFADVLGTLSGPVSSVSGTTEANEEVLVEVTGTLSSPVSSVIGALTSETIEAEITGTVTAPISSVSGSVVATEILAELTGAITGPISAVSGTAYIAALVTLSGAIETPVSGITGIVDITAGALLLRVGSVRVYDELFMGSLP